jgi:hypothetical protein
MPLRIKLIILVITSLSLFGFKVKHPFYLGVCHFKHNTAENNLEASVKLFANDFEDALKKTFKKPVDVLNGVKNKEVNSFIEQYVKQHLNVKVNALKLECTYLGYEIEKEVVWIYLEYKAVKHIKSVEITNSLLYDFFPGQTHIIRLDCNNTERSSKISMPDKTVKELY